jgi:hypothetical protein
MGPANIEAGSGETTIEVGDRTVEAKTTVVRSTSPEWEQALRHLEGTLAGRRPV